MAGHLGYANGKTLLEHHLSYILSHWHKKRLGLGAFPHALVDCESVEDLFRNFSSVVVPLLIEEDVVLLESLCGRQSLSLKKVAEVSSVLTNLCS